MPLTYPSRKPLLVVPAQGVSSTRTTAMTGIGLNATPIASGNNSPITSPGHTPSLMSSTHALPSAAPRPRVAAMHAHRSCQPASLLPIGGGRFVVVSRTAVSMHEVRRARAPQHVSHLCAVAGQQQ